MIRRVVGPSIVVSLLAVWPAGAGPSSGPRLVAAGSYDTGLAANGAEILSVRSSDGLAVLTNIAGSVDVLDLSDPEHPTLLRRVTVDTTTGTPNSAAIHPTHDFFLVVTGRAGAVGKVHAYRVSDGQLLASADVGIQPDSIAIAPNGRYAVVANEAEGVNVGLNGGEGSLSVVDLAGFNGVVARDLVVTPITLASAAAVLGFSTGRSDDIARVVIDNTPATLEPESVAFTENSRYAYVTLQENSGVVRLDMQSLEVVYLGLGEVDHLADVTNGAGYVPTSPLIAYREPDGIALDQTGRFFVTADEGDTRNAAGVAGPRGGRTVSVFDAQHGALLGDTGSQLDDAAAAAGVYPDTRSNRGGTEPEVLDLTHDRGRALVAVWLERANAVALLDVTDPTAPTVLDLHAVGANPEGIAFFRVQNRLYLAVANEADGTVSVLEVAD